MIWWFEGFNDNIVGLVVADVYLIIDRRRRQFTASKIFQDRRQTKYAFIIIVRTLHRNRTLSILVFDVNVVHRLTLNILCKCAYMHAKGAWCLYADQIACTCTMYNLPPCHELARPMAYYYRKSCWLMIVTVVSRWIEKQIVFVWRCSGPNNSVCLLAADICCTHSTFSFNSKQSLRNDIVVG